MKAAIDYMRERRDENRSSGTLESESQIIDRLLRHPGTLRILEALEPLDELQWRVVLDEIIRIDAFWSPERTQTLREAMAQLRELKDEIGQLADRLANKIEKRDALREQHAIEGSADHSVLQWIERAARWAGAWPDGIEKLRLLDARFDGKYWPESADVVRAIGYFSDEADVQPGTLEGLAATESRQASRRDFFRPLLDSLDALRGAPPEYLPSTWRLPDSTLAEIGCIVLDIEDGSIEPHQIKLLRQRRRRP